MGWLRACQLCSGQLCSSALPCSHTQTPKGRAAAAHTWPSKPPSTPLTGKEKQGDVHCFYSRHGNYSKVGATPVPGLTMLCITHGNLAKRCSASHLPWIILFDRQVKYFNSLIPLLLLTRKEGSRGLPWETSWQGCLIEASVEFRLTRQRLNKKKPLGPKRLEWGTHRDRDLTARTCKLSVSDPLNISTSPGSVLESSPELLSMPSPSHKGDGMEGRGAACAPEPRWMSQPLNASGTALSAKASMQKDFLRQKALRGNC